MSFTIVGFELTGPVLLLGAITGMSYGILAVGLVLIYRSSRIINFAHGDIGAFGAAFLGLAVLQWRLPYWIAFPLACFASALVGAFSELAVVRRLRNAPNVMSIVATLGLGQIVLLLSLILSPPAGTTGYPQPSFLPSFDAGPLLVTPAYSAMLFLSPIIVVLLALFLKRTRYGLGIRATAANQEAARVSGVFAGRMSMLAWALGGAVAAFAAILIRPSIGFVSATAEVFGPTLLLRALAPAVIARMQSLPAALASGVVLGIVEQELLWNYPSGGLAEMVIFGIILVGLLIMRSRGGREEEKGSWAAVQPWPPLPEAVMRVPSVRHLGLVTAALGFALAIGIGLVTTNASAITLVLVVSFALVGLSVGVVTGLSGQLSLGQFTIAGFGALVSYYIMRETGNFPLGVLGGAGAAAAVSILIGLPALRVRGLMLAVTTLSFALACSKWLFRQPWAFSEGVASGTPRIASYNFESGTSYYMLSLVILALGMLLAWNIWRGGLGRRMRAIRDNEDNARAFTVPATIVKLQAFALAGILAGLGGALFGHALSRVSSSAFPIRASINLVALTALGGIGTLAGPLIGALYIIAVPAFVPLDNAGLAATSLGWFLLILYRPGGFAQVFAPLRHRIVNALAKRAGVDSQLTEAAAPSTVTITEAVGAAAGLTRASFQRASAFDERKGHTLLTASGLRKYFGGVRAVDNVTLEVREGETLGLIGPNGAGKTTLFELLSGFTRADSGQVAFLGRDITHLGPEARGRVGMIRSFQDASLFPTLTVIEALKLAQERTAPTSLLRSAIGIQGPERLKEERARELVALMGLDQFRHKQINELSTGTRRITELTCLLALEPKLLLLDEPSSGIAQRETDALGDLLLQLKKYLGVTLVVIEHDIPLIMRISDRIIAMESGQIIANDAPDVVRDDERVIESYLGADVAAIERSGAARQGSDGRCQALTRSGGRCRRRAVLDGVCAQHGEVAVLGR